MNASFGNGSEFLLFSSTLRFNIVEFIECRWAQFWIFIHLAHEIIPCEILQSEVQFACTFSYVIEVYRSHRIFSTLKTLFQYSTCWISSMKWIGRDWLDFYQFSNYFFRKKMRFEMILNTLCNDNDLYGIEIYVI